MNPRYPVYVISKGRWESRLTSKALERLRVPYRIVVEPQEVAQYAAVIDPSKVLVLPFSNLGQGSIPARNWVWQHAIAEGHARHWILDDNIGWFERLNRNVKHRFTDGVVFAMIEDFADRYDNLAMAGPNYRFFAKQRQVIPPVNFNTRVYSCILLSNSVPHRWRGRYNEDTDLSLRFLKDGYCTALFNALLAAKATTLTMKGGNTDELYKRDAGFDGRLEMAKSLQEQHPDVVRVSRKFGRWQHHVDYRPFKNNRAIRRKDVVIPDAPNEYGMKLVTVGAH